MDTTVTVEVRTTYGVDRIYPVGRTATLLAELTGKRTFDSADLATITALGYDVTEIATPRLSVPSIRRTTERTSQP